MKKDIILYQKEGKFAAWPANYLCKNWNDEIVAGFFIADHYSGPVYMHSYEPDKEHCIYLARSLDNGETWTAEPTPLSDPAPSDIKKMPEILRDFDGNIDFTHPDFMLMFNRSGEAKEDFSWWYYSMDRGHTWDGPFKIPLMPELTYGLNMRTEYKIISKDELLFFGTCQKSTEIEGRVFCAKLTEGGKRAEFVGWIDDELPGKGFMIMPQVQRRKDGTLVAITRVREDTATEDEYIFYMGQYESADEGKTWVRKANATGDMGGNPPALTVMGDGTWVLIFGRRTTPTGIRCVYSEDEGRTWSKEIIIRDDTTGNDLGYPRAITRNDGSVFVCYYFCENKDKERYIAASIFDKEFLKNGK